MSTTDHPTIAMRPDMFPCPACGGLPIGTIDMIVCRWSTDQVGDVTDWQGNDLETQDTLYRDGCPVLACENGHDYTHADFTGDVMSTLQIERNDDDHDTN